MSVHIRQISSNPFCVWSITNSWGEFQVSEQGAQLLSWRQHEQPALIWLSPNATYESQSVTRGGVPICWPWFGALDRNPQIISQQYSELKVAPAHGLVRQIPWLLKSIGSCDEAVTLLWQCPIDTHLTHIPALKGIHLTLLMQLAEDVRLSLHTTNLSEDIFHFSQALHTYMGISAIERISVNGLEDSIYVDALDDWQTKHQSGILHFKAETDRLYFNPKQDIQLVDSLWHRKTNLQASGSASLVIWNPWETKSKNLSQMHPNGWRDFLCIETANVLSDSIQLQAGDQHRLEVHLKTEN